MLFTELNINPKIVQALSENGITKATKIQAEGIPLMVEGYDVVGISKTGSGKTAAFGIPILERVEKGKGIQALLLAPTRELAVQISEELQKFGKYLGLNYATIFGGVAIGPQMDALTRAEIVVATPGRLLDHIGRETINLSGLSCFVLDEADKMVEMGFVEDIERILSYTPENRQILLFGATISLEINRLRDTYMYEPTTVKAEAQVSQELLEQFYYVVDMREKFSLLAHLLKKEETKRVMIFCSARSTVELVTQNLKKHGFPVEMIHGKLSQNRRLSVIKGFNEGKTKILVGSSVAARGLNIQEVSHVFNYDLAQDPQEYIHRIGRTARAGKSGKAITLLSDRDFSAFSGIVDRYAVKVEKLVPGVFPKLRFETRSRNNTHGGFNRSGGHGSSFNRGGFGGGRFNRDNNRGRSFGGAKPAVNNSRRASWNTQ